MIEKFFSVKFAFIGVGNDEHQNTNADNIGWESTYKYLNKSVYKYYVCLSDTENVEILWLTGSLAQSIDGYVAHCTYCGCVLRHSLASSPDSWSRESTPSAMRM